MRSAWPSGFGVESVGFSRAFRRKRRGNAEVAWSRFVQNSSKSLVKSWEFHYLYQNELLYEYLFQNSFKSFVKAWEFHRVYQNELLYESHCRTWYY